MSDALPETKLGEFLCQQGFISSEQLIQGLSWQEQKGGRLGEVLFYLGFLSNESLLAALEKKYRIRTADLTAFEIAPEMLQMLPFEQMKQYNVLPLAVNHGLLYLAMTDPGNMGDIRDIEFRLGCNVHPVVVPSSQIKTVFKFMEEMEEKGGKLNHPLRVRDLYPKSSSLAPREEFLPLNVLCKLLVSERASDLLLSVGAPPSLKKNGELVRLPYPRLTQEKMVEYAQELMAPSQWEEFQHTSELDFSIDLQGVGRFRGNVFLQRGTISLSIRAINEVIPSFADLGLPGWLGAYALRAQGLILISGPTGQGKSTTLASVVDLINSHKKANIITIEEPIEYLHRHKLSNVNQREVGCDTGSFHEGLKRVFRQAPDIIVIGEIRDPESASIAVQAASTGHLVISTVHSSNATMTIERLIDLLPPDQQHQIRVQLAESLILVLNQRLVPASDGKGVVLAYEKLVNTQRVRSIIRDDKTFQIRNLFQQGSDDFQSLDSMLGQLCREGRISQEEALKLCDNRSFMLDAMERGGRAAINANSRNGSH